MVLELKIHDAGKKLPKLLPINPVKRRYQLRSKRCLVWWEWVNGLNQKVMQSDDSPRFAFMYNNNYWQIEGVSGETRVLKWCYVPNPYKQAPID